MIIRISFVLLCCATIFAEVNGQAAGTIQTGIRTVDLAADRAGFLYALAEGRDLNFDTVLDTSAGERPGSIFRIDPATNQIIKQRTFGGFLRDLAIHEETGYLVQNHPDRLTSFDLETLATVQDTFILADTNTGLLFHEVSIDRATGYLAAGTGGFETLGEVVMFDNTGMLLHRAQTGIGAGEVIFFDLEKTRSRALLAINEGTFGGNNATLSYLNIQRRIFQATTGRNLGDTGTSLFLDDDHRLYLVMNGSHRIEVYDAEELTSLAAIPTGTSGFDGPRQVVIGEDGMTGVVSTFANDIRFFDLALARVTDTLAVGQKPEEMASFRNRLYVANGGFTGFAEDSTIFVVDWQQRSVIDTIVTGIRTTQILLGPDSMLYALSEGRDLNFDRMLQPEDGEVPAQLFRIDPESHQIVARRTLSSFASELAITLFPEPFIPTILSLYCFQTEPERLSIFDPSTLETIKDTLLLASTTTETGFRGLRYDNRGARLLVTTGGFTETGGELLVLQDGTGELIHRFRTGVGAADIAVLDSPAVPQGRRWLVLNEGFFGSESSTLSMIDFARDIFEPIAGRRLGDTANSGIIEDGIVYLVINGSHRVEMLDPVNFVYLGGVDTRTTGFDGPRQVAILNDRTGLVTTFANDLRSFDLNSGNIANITPVGRKPEDVLVLGDRVYVANGGFTGFSEDSTISVLQAQTVPVAENSRRAPAHFSLAQNHPNPVSRQHPETSISFMLTEPAETRIAVYNLIGQRVVTLLNRFMAAGSHTIAWDGKDSAGNSLAPGVYYYRMQQGERSASRKMIIVP